jgi:hypothetical protein
VLSSAPKVRSFRKNLLRKKMAPPRSRASRWMGLPQRKSRREATALVLDRRPRVRPLRKFPVQSCLPPQLMNATNFAAVPDRLFSFPQSDHWPPRIALAP